MESKAGGNSGRILTRDPRPRPSRRSRRLDGGGQHLASQEGRAPLITNQLVGHVDNPSYLLTAVDIHLSLGTPENAWGDYGSLPGGFGKVEDAYLAVAGAGEGPSLCHDRPHLVAVCKRDRRADVTQGVAGLVTPGGRASWTTGELAAWAWMPATHSIISNPTRPSTPETSRESHSSYGKAILIAYESGWTIA